MPCRIPSPFRSPRLNTGTWSTASPSFPPDIRPVGSTAGHALAGTSPLQAGRLADAPRRLQIARRAILERDFASLAEIVEHDSNLMHAVMMTSTPPLFYWEPALHQPDEISPILAAGRPALLLHPGCRA